MTTIADLLPAYVRYMEHERQFARSTVQSYLYDLRDLCKHVGTDVRAITLSELRDYQRSLSLRGSDARTIHRHFNGFMTFWRWMRLEGYVAENLIERITLPKIYQHIPRWLSEGEIERFVNTPARGIDDAERLRNSTAWRLLAWLGIRRCELLGLRVADVRIQDKIIIVSGIKNKRDRAMPLPEPLTPALAALTAHRRADAYLLENRVGNRWHVKSFMAAFREQLDQAGLADRGITPHVLRHTFATKIHADGLQITDVQALLGHADLKSTMVYTHIDPRRLARAMDGHFMNRIDRTEG